MITGRILRAEESKDQYNNICIVVEFSEDGKVIVPEWILFAKFENFIGMDTSQIIEWIRLNIEYQIGNIIKSKNTSLLNAEFMTAIDKLKGTVFQTDKVEIPMLSNAVVVTPYKVVLNSDGTYTKVV